MRLKCANRPRGVVHIQHRFDRNEVHAGLIVGVERPHRRAQYGVAMRFSSRKRYANTFMPLSIMYGMMFLPKSWLLSDRAASWQSNSKSSRVLKT